MARSAAVLPIELLLHALVVLVHPPYLVSVATLTASSTVLAVWVVEPAAMRLLRTWLHAPARAERDRLHAADAL
jgi:antibiotic biosynthesis monooxygenase (ABM) superfamily enzyme